MTDSEMDKQNNEDDSDNTVGRAVMMMISLPYTVRWFNKENEWVCARECILYVLLEEGGGTT